MKPCRYQLSGKQCRSRSAGFFRSQLIRIHTVFNTICELIIVNQNMKYKILLTLYKYCTCPRTSKLKFSTCPEYNGTRSDKSGMVFPQPWIIPFHSGYQLTGTMANSEDQDAMSHCAAFYQGLHCMLR